MQVASIAFLLDPAVAEGGCKADRMERFPDILDFGEGRLRTLSRGDFPAIVRQLSDLETSQWLAAVSHPFDQPQAEEIFEHAEAPDQITRIIECSGRAVGCIGLGHGVWFWLEPECRSKGLMRRALTTALQNYFEFPRSPLVATCRPDNTTSIRLLSAVGFSSCPRTRRVFFHSVGQPFSCLDFAVTPEQWHFLYPPTLTGDGLSGRPAKQADTPELAALLRDSKPAGLEVWPEANHLTEFLERYRWRGDGQGLFVFQDDYRCIIGATLLGRANESAHSVFRSTGDEEKYRQIVLKMISNRFPSISAAPPPISPAENT